MLEIVPCAARHVAARTIHFNLQIMSQTSATTANQAFHPAVSWISRGKMTTVTQQIRTSRLEEVLGMQQRLPTETGVPVNYGPGQVVEQVNASWLEQRRPSATASKREF